MNRYKDVHFCSRALLPRELKSDPSTSLSWQWTRRWQAKVRNRLKERMKKWPTGFSDFCQQDPFSFPSTNSFKKKKSCNITKWVITVHFMSMTFKFLTRQTCEPHLIIYTKGFKEMSCNMTLCYSYFYFFYIETCSIPTIHFPHAFFI